MDRPALHWMFVFAAAGSLALPSLAKDRKVRAWRHDDGFWQTAGATDRGWNREAVAAHEDLCRRTSADSCLVVYDDRIVSEYYAPTYRLPVPAMSTTKAVTSLLVGMLMADGKLTGLDTPVQRILPEWTGPDKEKVTLRHLLTHTAGFERRRSKEDGSVGFVRDKNPHVMALPLSWAPGSRFAYSNEGAQLLSPVLDRAAGEPIHKYAYRRLFVPLGMKDTRLNLDEAGHAWTYADMKTTTRDLARIGLLMLHKGSWRGKRIVPEDYVALATTQATPLDPECGLLWWLLDDPKGFAARGYLDTNVYVFPDLGLVVVRTQSKSHGAEGTYERPALELFKKMVSAPAS